MRTQRYEAGERVWWNPGPPPWKLGARIAGVVIEPPPGRIFRLHRIRTASGMAVISSDKLEPRQEFVPEIDGAEATAWGDLLALLDARWGSDKGWLTVDELADGPGFGATDRVDWAAVGVWGSNAYDDQQTVAQELGRLCDELHQVLPSAAEVGSELAAAHEGLVKAAAARLRKAAGVHGPALQPSTLLTNLEEILEEVADIVGWSAVLWARINRVRAATADIVYRQIDEDPA